LKIYLKVTNAYLSLCIIKLHEEDVRGREEYLYVFLTSTLGSNKLHASGALSLRKGPEVPIGQENEWVPESI
jgi:hypothetical protein